MGISDRGFYGFLCHLTMSVKVMKNALRSTKPVASPTLCLLSDNELAFIF